MVSATGALLEERLSMGGNPFPALAHAVTELFLDAFSSQRHLLRAMQGHEQRGQYVQAAECAVKLGDYQ